jgi:NAD kinase
VILADTGFWLALANRADVHHARAVAALEKHRGPFVTTWPVMTETCHLLAARLGTEAELAFIRSGVRGAFRIVALEPTHLPRIEVLMRKYASLPMDLADASLVITIGGDGTFLTVARHVGSTPMLGINSSPSTSTGHYCSATTHTFAAILDGVLNGLSPVPLTRIAAFVEGEPVRPFALNDVLFAHRSPVASSRYALKVDDRSELQLSSGIWISTATGSTAAILSAGGSEMKADDPRLQFRVREPYSRGENRLMLLSGFCETLEIVSRSDKNALFLDGHQDPVTVPFGARVRIERANEPLFAFLSPDKL